MSSPKSLDVLGVGCNSVDYVSRLPAPPRADSPTAKMRISSHTVSFGGQTATTMAACSALGLRAGYLGAVGNVDNRSGERLVFWDRDPHLNLSAADIHPEVIASARVVHVDDEDQDASICAARTAREANVIVTSDIDRMTSR